MKPPAAELIISLLGPFQAVLDGKPLHGFRSAKVRALLAFLAVESHRPWPRSVLGELLWPALGEKETQSNLRNALSNLRTILGDPQRNNPFILISKDTLQINPRASYWLDVQAFNDLSASAPAGDVPLLDHEFSSLEQALELFRGDFLEGFYINSAPFDEWLLVSLQHIRRKVVDLLRLLVIGYTCHADPNTAFKHARHWIKLEPLDEQAHQHFMLILTHLGQRNAALAHYEAYKDRLYQELGVEPAPETIQLYEQIRRGQLELHSQESSTLHSPLPGQIPGFLLDAQRTETEAAFFVARQKELKRLEEELAEAVNGHGRAVLITGDPGSGKSALIAEFLRQAMEKHPSLVAAQSQCTAYTGEADPFFPFLEILKILSGDLEARVAGGSLHPNHALRLWRFLPSVIKALVEEGPDLINRFISGATLLVAARSSQQIQPSLLARLQTLAEGTPPRPIRSPIQQAALFSQITRMLSNLSHQRPLVLVIDDLQWIDTDSANLLFHLGRHLSGSPLLLIGAYRPEDVALGRKGGRHPLKGVVHELQAALGDIHIDLMNSEGDDFIEALVDSEPNQLTLLFRQQLHRHTAGHPLFSIELLRGMQLRGDLYWNEQGKWIASRRLNWEALPARVEAVIAERIEHLPPACQDLLNIACVEGEHFTAEILAKISGTELQQVIQTLSQEIGKRHRLVIAQCQRQVGNQILFQYRFRHILYQKYLYQHLDVVQKTHLHQKIGTALEGFFQQHLNRYPEIIHQLARHFHLGGQPEKAVHYYAESSRYALQLGGYRDAIAHLEHALELVRTLTSSQNQDRLELQLRLSLGPLLTAAQGWAAPELEENYRQAEALCRKIGDNDQLVPALWLLAVYRLGRAEHAAVDSLTNRLESLARQIGDPGLLSLASLQVSPLYQGRLVKARQILVRASASRDVEQQRRLAVQYGMSPSVVALAYLAHCVWLLGSPRLAFQFSREACEMAAAVDVPMTTCYALAREMWQHAFAGDIEPIPALADQLIQVAQQHGLQSFELAAIFFSEWAKSQVGVTTWDGIDGIAKVMEQYKSLGNLLNRTTFLNLFAQACLTAGRLERGLAAVTESIRVGEHNGERWFEAESYRLKGELLVRQAGDFGQAGACFEAARQTALRQGAKMLEMRAINSLIDLRQTQGRDSTDMREMIRKFTEEISETEISLGDGSLGEPGWLITYPKFDR